MPLEKNTAEIVRMTIVGPDGVSRKESKKQARAFSIWLGLGGGGRKSTMQLVCEHPNIDVVIRTVWRWYSDYRWQDRLAQRNDKSLKAEGVAIAVEAKAEEALSELPRPDEAIVQEEGDSLAKILRLIDTSIDEYETRLQSGKIIINSPKDLETLAKLRSILTGGPGDEKPVNIQIITGIPRPTGHPIHPTIIDMEHDEEKE